MVDAVIFGVIIPAREIKEGVRISILPLSGGLFFVRVFHGSGHVGWVFADADGSCFVACTLFLHFFSKVKESVDEVVGRWPEVKGESVVVPAQLVSFCKERKTGPLVFHGDFGFGDLAAHGEVCRSFRVGACL